MKTIENISSSPDNNDKINGIERAEPTTIITMKIPQTWRSGGKSSTESSGIIKR